MIAIYSSSIAGKEPFPNDRRQLFSGGSLAMRSFKQSILISLLLLAAITYAPSSHVLSQDAALNVCTEGAR